MRTRGKQNDEKYLKCFVDLYNEIVNDPRCNTQKVLRKWKMSNGVTSILQRMNVVEKDENQNWIWVGSYPNMEMVHEVKKISMRIQKKYQRPKSMQPEIIFNKHEDPKIEAVKIKPLRSCDVKERKTLITHKVATEPKQKMFEISLFGFKIFTLKH
jgi:hypothetical protein